MTSAVVALRLRNVRGQCVKVALTNAELLWAPRVWYGNEHEHEQEQYGDNVTTVYGGTLNAWVLTTGSMPKITTKMPKTMKHKFVSLPFNKFKLTAASSTNVDEEDDIFVRVHVASSACDKKDATHKTTITQRVG
jgi:hypothetical protein